MTTSFTTLSSFAKALDFLGDSAGRDITLRQLHTLAVVAAAGTGGVDVTQLAEQTDSSAAAISRNIRVFGSVHYKKEKGAGLGFVDVALDPFDNRRRIVRITEKGLEVVRKALSFIK